MISIIHYISASRRLKELQKTVDMLGGESEAPPMTLAQRDICTYEKEYYADEVFKTFFGFLILLAICGLTFLLYKLYGVISVK
jgi:hypothetical protein